MSIKQEVGDDISVCVLNLQVVEPISAQRCVYYRDFFQRCVSYRDFFQYKMQHWVKMGLAKIKIKRMKYVLESNVSQQLLKFVLESFTFEIDPREVPGI